MRLKVPKKLKNISRRTSLLALAILLAASGFILWRPGRVHAQTDTFSTPGTFTWNVPAGVSSADFEAWGGGGAGGGASTSGDDGGGGAGGQYAIKHLTGLVTNDAYTITVAASVAGATGAGSTGNDSQVTNPLSAVVVTAKGGAGGVANTGASSGGTGSTTNGVGDTVNAGGNGGSGFATSGGGGGGGAGSTGAGGNGATSTAGTGTSLNGGNGGIGGGNSNGSPGNNYGGGGGGAAKSNGSNKTGGAGAQGLVTVTYTIVTNSSPNDPTNTSPSDGSTVISTTPNLQMTTTDPEGDAVKYKIWFYSGATVDGFGSCSGIFIGNFDQTASGVGWDNGTTAYASGATATYTIQSALTRGAGYCWQSQAIDPSGSNAFSGISTATTFTVNSIPDSPTLISPASGATGVATTPSFTLRTRDSDSDYLQYRVYLYQSDCSTAVSGSPFDMSGTGWSGMDANGATAYVGSATLTSSTIATYTYQGTLSNNTVYCWQADATDPGGSNNYSSVSATQLFTTLPPPPAVSIQGGVKINGGSTIQ